jgi:hypothetical protein
VLVAVRMYETLRRPSEPTAPGAHGTDDDAT